MAIIKFDKLGLREKVGLSIAGLFIVFMIIDRLVVASVVSTLNDMQQRISTAEKELNYNKSVLKRKDEISARYEGISSLIGITVSPAEEIDNMSMEIADLATRMQIDYDSSQREPRKHAFYEEYFVDIRQFECEMNNLLVFLHEVQKSPGMFRVSKLSVSSEQNDTRVKGSMLISKVMMLAPGAREAENSSAEEQ